jgi:hypothetical protein
MKRSLNMKKRIFIGLVAMLAAGLILVACGSSSSYSTPPSPPNKWANVTYTGEDERLLEGTAWIFRFTDGTTLEFRRGGNLVVEHPAWRGNASWQRTGDTVEFVMNNGFIYFEGIYYPESQRILGTAYDSYNHRSDQTLIPASSSIATAAPQTVYVQPSAPAQSSTPAPAPSAPTFQPGRYAFSGSNITMSLTGYQARAYSGYDEVAWGTYRINGNQIVITFNTGNGAGASLQGKTFAYTITSNTSFSGNGETWVRTGY